MKAFLDTNVLMDWLQESRPCNESAKAIVTAAENNSFTLTISTQSMVDAAYSLRKAGLPFESFVKAFRYLRTFVRIVGIDEIDFLWAVEHHSGDFEDDMQYASAYNSVCDYFITRDKKLMELNNPLNPMTVMSPDEFVARMME